MADDPLLRAAYAAHAAPQDDHPDELAWERLATDELRQEERERLADHLARCAECVQIYRGVTLLREEAWDTPRVASATWRRPAAVMGVLAAAAAALLMLRGPAAPQLAPGGAPATGTGADVLRQADVARPVTLEPHGRQHATPGRFRWRALGSAARYSVHVFDEQGDRVWSSPATAGGELPWPAELRWAPGRYHWQVVVLLPEGRGHDTLTSAMADFELTADGARPNP